MNSNTPYGYICSPPVYKYRGWLFECGPGGPWPLRKDGTPRKRCSAAFWRMVSEWFLESDWEKYRVGGGCEPF